MAAHLFVSFRDENMQSFEALPAQPVNFAPTAIQALQVAGFGPTNLLRVDDATAASNLTPLNSTQFNAIMALANNTASYVSSTAGGGANLPVVASAPTSPASGAIWFNSSTGSLQFYNGSTTQSIGTSSSTGTVTSVGTGTGLTGGPITASGTISLANFGTAGTYYKVTTDVTGRVSSGSAALVENDIPNLVTAGHVSGSAITSGTIAGSTAVNTTGNVAAANVAATSLSGQSLLLYNSGSTHKTTLSVPPTLAADYNLVFPLTAGTSGYVLSTDGAGNLSWIPANTGIFGSNVSQAPTATGAFFSTTASTLTDNSTAASGTTATAAFSSHAAPTLAATNTGVTTTNASNLYLAGAPMAGAHETLTNTSALYVASDAVNSVGTADQRVRRLYQRADGRDK